MLNWVEINTGALRNNIAEFRRRLSGGTKLGAVVKANAYGHGLHEIASVASEAEVDWFCVNNIGEAAALHDAGHRNPVLIMGYVPNDALDEVVTRGLRPVVYNVDTLDGLHMAAARHRRPVKVHLKVETGTYRQGVTEEGLVFFLDRIRGSEWLELEGLTTHYANIEDTTDHSFAEKQIATFERIADSVGPVPLRHTACSAAAILFTRTHMDLARIGISLYGLWPSRETYVSRLETGKPTLDLQPVMTWKTRIVQVKKVPEGAFIGYGCTHRVTRPSVIAVLPVGYYEGYDRGLSGIAHVLVRGRRAPVRGRVCMNMMMVDVTDIPDASLGDEVVLLGAQNGENVTAEQLARWRGTISYEIVSRIHPSLPRLLT
ncbi:MAG: alanine racemase, partial [Acidobacteriota bacterium]|nr:alanine racemase [Acidobacteriota bacterium]